MDEMRMDEIEFMEMFAANLRDIMYEKGYSQKELAEDTNIAPSAINSYLKANKLIGIRSLINICCVLDCGVEELLPYNGYVMFY